MPAGISGAERAYIAAGVGQDLRNDGRRCRDARPLELELDVIAQVGRPGGRMKWDEGRGSGLKGARAPRAALLRRQLGATGSPPGGWLASVVASRGAPLGGAAAGRDAPLMARRAWKRMQPQADGSARLRVGGTDVIVAVKVRGAACKGQAADNTTPARKRADEKLAPPPIPAPCTHTAWRTAQQRRPRIRPCPSPPVPPTAAPQVSLSPPDAASPDKGQVFVSVECSSCASPEFKVRALGRAGAGGASRFGGGNGRGASAEQGAAAGRRAAGKEGGSSKGVWLRGGVARRA